MKRQIFWFGQALVLPEGSKALLEEVDKLLLLSRSALLEQQVDGGTVVAELRMLRRVSSKLLTCEAFPLAGRM